MKISKGTLLLLSALATLSILATSNGRAGPWPRFRGPNGDGISLDKGVPVEWSEKDGILWKTTVPGLGNSSPVVWDDRLFVQSASADGKERWILCYSTSSGDMLWKQIVPGVRAHVHSKNSLASSTPATDGERVYAVVWDGKEVGVHVYDVRGTPLWHRTFGSFVSQHGAGMSPIICDGKVIVANDQDGSSTLVALDAQSGRTVWQTPREPFRACYSTPFVLEQESGSPRLIVASTAGVTSYNPTDGKADWNWKWAFSGMPLRTVASPVFQEGMVFVNSGDGNGDRHTVAVQLGKDNELAGPRLVWEKQRGFPYVPSMLVSSDHLFYVNDDGIAGCYVARTGEAIWTERLGGKVTASPVLINGNVYAANESGSVFVFPATTTFRLLAKNQLGEAVMATPAVSDGRLYIRGKEHLFCIGRPRG
jgi:outer membrane protein assembly factor BamB